MDTKINIGLFYPFSKNCTMVW